ncbi:MAG: hypothetical protein M3Y37_09505, partial [Chloroflexota bacterium]|nr:hypothetical protein [Chloroflexota bacterium]
IPAYREGVTRTHFDFHPTNFFHSGISLDAQNDPARSAIGPAEGRLLSWLQPRVGPDITAVFVCEYANPLRRIVHYVHIEGAFPETSTAGQCQ